MASGGGQAMRAVVTVFGVISGLNVSACGGGGSGPATQPPLPPPSATPFVDVTPASNIAYQVGYTRPPVAGRGLRGAAVRQLTMMTIGGAAAGDCDNDGDIDLFITYGNTGGPDGGGGPNRLYMNQLAEQGDGLLFVDNAEQAGVANTRSDGAGNDRHSGPVFVDMNGNGHLDLFVGGIYGDPNKIYENQGDCTFVDVTSNSPDIENMIAPHTISAAFGDYDLDGRLDMFLTHWGTLDELYGVPRTRQTDHLFRNESDESGIRFVNVSEETGVSELLWLTRPHMFCGHRFCDLDVGQVQIADFTFTPTFARINDDPWPDIAVAADFGTTQLFINNGDGTFRNFDNPILRDAQFGMGSALGDINNNGRLDWFVTSILGPGDRFFTPQGNRLFINVGGSSGFIEDTARLGVSDGGFGWGACFLDINNNGRLDIYHTNGFRDSYFSNNDGFDSDPSRAFVMNEAGTYTEQGDELGFARPTSGRGVVCADFDNDGDIDILELTEDGPILWENRTAAAGRNSLRVRLVGLPPNTEAAGARIFARIDDTVQMREIMIGSNYTSQNPTVQIFGLDSSTIVDELFVEWPAKDSGPGPVQLGTVVTGPIAASRPGETLVIRHPELP
jgi:enediyne biosynthesis protein E4